MTSAVLREFTDARLRKMCKPFVKNTGDTFRSYVLGVMSPARFPCATPVK
jgi:hypothetical protein